MKTCNLVRGNHVNAFVFRQYITPKNVQIIKGKTLGMGYHRPDSHLIYSIPKLRHNLNCRSKGSCHGFKTIENLEVLGLGLIFNEDQSTVSSQTYKNWLEVRHNIN